METSKKPHKTQSNGRVKPHNRYIQARTVPGPGYTCVFYTPRFSYGYLKTAICACPGVLVLVPVGRGVHVRAMTGVRVGYRRVGIPGG